MNNVLCNEPQEYYFEFNNNKYMAFTKYSLYYFNISINLLKSKFFNLYDKIESN